jgi:hypothetical protein
MCRQWMDCLVHGSTVKCVVVGGLVMRAWKEGCRGCSTWSVRSRLPKLLETRYDHPNCNPELRLTVHSCIYRTSSSRLQPVLQWPVMKPVHLQHFHHCFHLRKYPGECALVT